MINEEGRQRLIGALQNWKAHYSQDEFGKILRNRVCETNECGTVMCMAGMAYLLKVGWDTFLSDLGKLIPWHFRARCLDAGKELLRLPEGAHRYYEHGDIPQIFCSYIDWPNPFFLEYKKAFLEQNWDGLVDIAIRALMSMDEYGRLVVKLN